MKKDRYFYQTYFRLFSVVAMQSLILFGVNLADSMMLGRYSETAMSGVSLANQIQFLLLCVLNGAANGLVVPASQYWGKKETEPIKKLFAAALWTAVALAGVLALVAGVFPEAVLRLLSNESAIVAEGAAFLRIMAHSYIPFAFTIVLTGALRSVENVRVCFYSSLLALVVNITLNYALIFGRLGFSEHGVKGAAAATLISRLAELLFVVGYALFADKKLRLGPRDCLRIEKTYLLDYLRAGLPLVGSGGSWGFAMLIQTGIIGRLGAAAIGANAVSAPVFQVAAVLYTSSSSASSVLIGKTVGENDIPRVKRYTRKLQVMFLITGLLSAGILLLLKSAIIGFFDISPETAKLSTVFMNILAVTIVGSAYEAPCLVGIVSGGGDTKFVFRNDIIFMWGIVLPLSALSAFVFHWPAPVTFFLLKSDQLTKCIVAVIKVNRFSWIKKLTRDAADTETERQADPPLPQCQQPEKKSSRTASVYQVTVPRLTDVNRDNRPRD